ncbi:MAG: thioredoxin domain-containing protein [Candidatus Peregrinibacteria bacterium]|nr:thioredoxin domain-containing protein [Candidatus Peregrinibacteria bacterium]
MATLQWKDSPQESPHLKQPDSKSSPALRRAEGSNPLVVSAANPWFGVSLGLLGLIVGFGVARMNTSFTPSVVQPQQPQAVAPEAPSGIVPTAAAADVIPVDTKTEHIRGNPKATVAVIEYSDFECPFCQRVHPTYKQLMTLYGDKIMWVYRHYPLSFHQNAQPAAEASECVAELGGNEKFWEFADIVFERKRFDFATIAKEIGVNEAKFTACVSSKKHTQSIADDMNGGSASGVDGTPGNIVYNLETKESRLVSGAQATSAFQAAIDELL